MKPTHSMSAMTTASHGVTITLFHPPGFEVLFFGIYCWKFLSSFHLISLLKSVNEVDAEIPTYILPDILNLNQ